MKALTPKVHRLGTHRVLEPAGGMPQSAWRLDNTPVALENEILCDVEVLNVDSASFKQIADACGGRPEKIAQHIAGIVAQRGKQHNSVTGSGGMFVGRVRDVGEQLRETAGVRPGTRIASLVSLTLTPLYVEEVTRVDVATGRVWMRGQAILFESGLWARLPDDIEHDVALAVLDVAGAPAQVARLCEPGQTVVVVGADGKSGILSCAQAKDNVGAVGRVIGVVPDGETAGALLLQRERLVDELIVADACDAIAVSERVAAISPNLADVVVNCVNVPNTELGSILCAKENGVVYFFSMATSFTAAALGAEGAGRDVTMIVGNGYCKDHAAIALQTLRDHPPIHAYFSHKYAHR